MILYETKIINSGIDAAMFREENMMILFGEDAPSELADYSYIIERNEVNGSILPGMTLLIGESQYEITAVGNVVNKNLLDLGHITLKFDGSVEAELPGTLYLENKKIPEVAIGTIKKIK